MSSGPTPSNATASLAAGPRRHPSVRGLRQLGPGFTVGLPAAGQRGDPRVVGIGMLGSGFIAEFHADGLRHVPAGRVVANWGRGPERREAFAGRFGSRALGSMEEVCADPEVDLVVVSVPNH